MDATDAIAELGQARPGVEEAEMEEEEEEEEEEEGVAAMEVE